MNSPLTETLSRPNNMLLAPFSFLATGTGIPNGAWLNDSGLGWMNESGNYILSF